MFALHETTRKRLCRGAFFALCVAPAAATLMWIGSRLLPFRTARIADQLSRMLHAQVKLADWSTPRPQTVRTSGLTIADATGVLLLEASDVEWRNAGAAQRAMARQVALTTEQLPASVAAISTWLDDAPHQPLAIHAARLVLHAQRGQSQRFVLHDVRGRLEHDLGGRPTLQLEGFAGPVDASASSTPAARLAMTTAGSGPRRGLQVTLDARETPIPARCLAPFVPGFGRVGEDAGFQGVIRWSADVTEPTASAQGVLRGVDFAAVLPMGTPHRLAGTGMIELGEWKWRGAKVVRLAGVLRVKDGQVSPSLVDAAVTKLFCQRNSQTAADSATADMLPLDELALRFELDGEGLLFTGQCPLTSAGVEGCLAVSRGQPLIVEPAYETFPSPTGKAFRFHLAHLVQALAAPAAIGVPASQEAIEIARPLPLPPWRPSLIR